jgi:hypothetical protein
MFIGGWSKDGNGARGVGLGGGVMVEQWEMVGEVI